MEQKEKEKLAEGLLWWKYSDLIVAFLIVWLQYTWIRIGGFIYFLISFILVLNLKKISKKNGKKEEEKEK